MNRFSKLALFPFLFVWSCSILVGGLNTAGAAIKATPQSARDIDPYMGIYEGKYIRGRKKVKAEARVVPQGGGSYKAVLTAEPVDAEKIRLELFVGDSRAAVQATRDAGPVLTGNGLGTSWEGPLTGKELIVTAKDAGKGEFVLKYVDRKSSTLGMKPPRKAVVLLPLGKDGRPSLEEWANKSWRPMPDGSMEVAKGNNKTIRKFGDIQLHLEFMCPYEPSKGGQGRGNSGVYIQSRYEVQVLDSFGLIPRKGDCGAIYGVAIPKVNACLPPLSWQTYDIIFRAARLSPDGRVEKHPVFESVKHNGITIHENQEVRGKTRAAGAGGHTSAAPLMLQDHGNRVRYRNIWIKEL